MTNDVTWIKNYIKQYENLVVNNEWEHVIQQGKYHPAHIKQLLNSLDTIALPENLIVKGSLDLYKIPLTNYPIVHNCGSSNRSLWLDFNDRNLIKIGCFLGTKEEAIKRIKNDYEGQAAQDYINKVNQCFQIQQDL